MATLQAVETVPEITREGKSSALLTEFMESGARAAVVQPEDTTDKEGNTKPDVGGSFAASLRRAIKAQGLPVTAHNRGGQVYLERTDIEAPAEA